MAEQSPSVDPWAAGISDIRHIGQALEPARGHQILAHSNGLGTCPHSSFPGAAEEAGQSLLEHLGHVGRAAVCMTDLVRQRPEELLGALELVALHDDPTSALFPKTFCFIVVVSI